MDGDPATWFVGLACGDLPIRTGPAGCVTADFFPAEAVDVAGAECVDLLFPVFVGSVTAATLLRIFATAADVAALLLEEISFDFYK